MQPIGKIWRANVWQLALREDAVRRFGRAAAVALIGAGLLTGAAAAETTGPVNTGASNGGIATATSGGNVNIGEIVTGENTGNSIQTGDISGPAEINGGEIDYPTDVNVTLDVGPPIATADGGDGGQATPASPEPPDLNVRINNSDKNNNKSNATGIGEGGEGGAGGDGGSAVIGTTP
ncbi:MAG: hypothetical protein U0031_02350 [Thermomicrobiales bacterium]